MPRRIAAASACALALLALAPAAGLAAERSVGDVRPARTYVEVVTVDPVTGLPVYGGGGAGGPTSIADGADQALGARSDAAWSGTGNGSLIAIMKAVRGQLAAPLSVTGTFWQATQPVSIAALPLPSGAATASAQAAANGSLAAISTALGAVATGADIATVNAKLDEILTNPAPAPIRPAGVATTDASGSVATGGVFQTVLVADAGRMGCLIQNPIAATETLFVYPGASGQTLAKAVNLAPGASFNCNAFGVVLTDAIQVTAATSGHAFVGKSQ